MLIWNGLCIILQQNFKTKKMKKLLVTIVFAVMTNLLVYSQTNEWEKPPKPGETVIANISQTVNNGGTTTYSRGAHPHCKSINLPNDEDTRKYYSYNDYYNIIYGIAKSRYGITHPNFKLRNFHCSTGEPIVKQEKIEIKRNCYYFKTSGESRTTCYATVVFNPKEEAYEAVSKVLNKALLGIRNGSKIAIDALIVSNGDDGEEYKDYVISLLLDKGYKVVAKEYLERLYEEQLNQQSGIYNENTVVQENNFSAVGYYLNLNVTESFIRAQVVNVSTGEYEGNVIESLNPAESKTDANSSLSKALDRGLNNVRMGSKVAIDGVSVPSETNKEYYKDQVINLLLDKGYKVVAKEYLQKLYNEQQDQLSGIYNENTTVQENNFSAVGYYINVKATDSSVRVQVVNVSTGEYEGNATVNF